jgi:hypothetical protein
MFPGALTRRPGSEHVNTEINVSAMPREAITDKATRLLAGHRLHITHIDGDNVHAVIHGDHGQLPARTPRRTLDMQLPRPRRVRPHHRPHPRHHAGVDMNATTNSQQRQHDRRDQRHQRHAERYERDVQSNPRHAKRRLRLSSLQTTLPLTKPRLHKTQLQLRKKSREWVAVEPGPLTLSRDPAQRGLERRIVQLKREPDRETLTRHLPMISPAAASTDSPVPPHHPIHEGP